MTSALYAAATAAYGPPVPSQPVPSTVRVHVTNLQRYTLTYPDWASQSSHLVEVARLKERIRAAWDVLFLEKDVGLAPLPAAPGQPTKVDYRRTLGARYVPPADPVYVPGVPVPLHQQAAVALEQLRQRHLAPLEALSLARVRTITGWEGRPLGPPPNATTANLRAIIRRAAATVPYHDLLEYRLFGQLEDAQFATIVSLINSILRGVPVPQAHSADFINLPKKTPHGPIANGRPLTNLATIWKLTAALIKDHYQPRMVQSGILPPYQFEMSPHCSSVELLRVLHDVWWDRWRRRLEAWVLSDDVRHAYGSINATPHRDALLHRGLRPARLRRLLCDVVLTTVLLHKRHAVPVLPLADYLSPLPRAPVNQSLANNPPPEWYHVANWAPTPGSGRWPAWDVLLGLWLSGDLLLAPKVKSVISTRSRHSPYRVLYVYIEKNQMPPTMRQEIEQNAPDVIILDSLGRHGLAPHLPGRRRLWAIHYGGNGRSLEAGLGGDVIPSWCAALHSAFSAILTAASQGPRTVFKDMQVAMGRPAPWPCPRP